ncbi:MAG TPA: MaoC family dehydratase [Acidimicrobiia bacterium]|nr:MaoC family dehydratase [Acidimicrobiia bacterium]
MTERTRGLTLTAELLRWYSRRGNFHADLDAARELGLTELVAQGMQVAGPAYGLLLDEWGDEWLATGTFELKFVGRVTAGETVDAHVDVEGDDATITVVGLDDGTTRVVGRATRRKDAGRG